MGKKYKNWIADNENFPQDYDQVVSIIFSNRSFQSVDKLFYGDNGLEKAASTIKSAIDNNKRIALYADYDVDGTMSCVSWVWFLKEIGYKNFCYYIPSRFKEGYGVNIDAIKHLIENENAEIIITMDTGITANDEAEYCKKKDIPFICTDHHIIQENKMPDCIILNPKQHPDNNYKELCGCGITFVLLRKLGESFKISKEFWDDILALTGMATICDVVPLNGVNHKIARLGVKSLIKSQRPILKKLRRACNMKEETADELDIGFRIGPRINAVGRLDHADSIIEAFVSESPDSLIKYMDECNEKRKNIQQKIIKEAEKLINIYDDDTILFLGSEDWHHGVVGIAANKLVEKYWRPTLLFQKNIANGTCKGSARSLVGFNIMDALLSAKDYLIKFGGHSAAAGFSFKIENEDIIRDIITKYALRIRDQHPEIWQSKITYDCPLPIELLETDLALYLDRLKPFGNAFKEPVFYIRAKIQQVMYFKDKTTGEPKHSAVIIYRLRKNLQRIMFFNEVITDLSPGSTVDFLVSASKNYYRSMLELSLRGIDYLV